MVGGGIMAGVRVHSALAMIELVLALVVMGIVLMSAPQLIATAKQSSITSVQQEAIALGASHMTMVLSRHWDEANTDPDIEVTILDTDTDTAAPNGLERNAGGVRAGTPTLGKHRSFFDAAGNTYAATANGSLGNEMGEANSVNDDIDDFDNTTATLQVSGIAGSDDYVDRQMQMGTTVRYISDSPQGATYNTNTNILTYNMPTGAVGRSSHIKYIQVILNSGQAASAELNTTLTFDAFSCNIGRHYYRMRAL